MSLWSIYLNLVSNFYLNFASFLKKGEKEKREIEKKRKRKKKRKTRKKGRFLRFSMTYYDV